METLIGDNVPRVKITFNDNRPKWWTRELQRKKNRRNKLYKRKLKGSDEVEYLAALNDFNE